VEADDLDEQADLGLGSAQAHEPPPGPQAPGEHRQVEHQRGVGEAELAQIDDEVGLGTQSTRQRPPSQALGGAILVADAAQPGGSVIEDDDR
jgi:hypothetical protein